jgi:hypothetical protein
MDHVVKDEIETLSPEDHARVAPFYELVQSELTDGRLR